MLRRLALVLLGLAGQQASAEDAGLSLYRSGTGAVALIAGGSVRVEASRFPCARCHGDDGAGSREGATVIPPVTWAALAVPTSARPAYDAASLGRALRDGLTPDGRTLSAVMPRYQVPPETLASLIDTLGRLDTADRVGFSATAVSVSVVPGDPRAAGFAAALALFDAEGGAWGRSVAMAAPDGAAALTLDEIASVASGRAAAAAEAMLFDRLIAEGHRRLRWLTMLPPEERDFLLMQRGLAQDSASPVVLWTDARAAGPAPEGAQVVYADLAAAARGLKPLLDSGVKLRLAVPEETVLWAALRDPDPLAYVEGYRAGTTLGQAMLDAGRLAGRARLMSALTRVRQGDLIVLLDMDGGSGSAAD